MNIAKLIRNIAFGMALLVLFSGVSTVFWPEAEGWVVDSKVTAVRGSSYNISGANEVRSTFHWPDIAYRFRIGSEKYVNHIYCICVPVGFYPPAPREKLTVSYFPLWPKLSVVRTGPDWIVASLMLLFCFLWHLAFFTGNNE
tara:strand:- start:362 stop:787 length:426 start_codon:yes stop_codon:yes gene_type:complete